MNETRCSDCANAAWASKQLAAEAEAAGDHEAAGTYMANAARLWQDVVLHQPGTPYRSHPEVQP